MYEIAEQVRQWLADGRTVWVACVVQTRGFSSRDASAALAWTDDGATAGALLAGRPAAMDTALPPGLHEITVSDADAVAGGLSCGGGATVLVVDAGRLGDAWDRLARREPLCLVTVAAAGEPMTTAVFTPGDVREAAQLPGADSAARLFARGTSQTALVTEASATTAVVTLWPPTRLLVVGGGLIAAALADVARVLGWSPVVTDDVTAATAGAKGLTESDAVVVLSHDRDVDGPVLSAVLAGRTGYVGALGSRHTQAARRQWLTDAGVSEQLQAGIHGPAGLDLDAHTPGEIAVSIVAEILATRAGAPGTSLRERPGPVHTGGVNAPPPRH